MPAVPVTGELTVLTLLYAWKRIQYWVPGERFEQPPPTEVAVPVALAPLVMVPAIGLVKPTSVEH